MSFLHYYNSKKMKVLLQRLKSSKRCLHISELDNWLNPTLYTNTPIPNISAIFMLCLKQDSYRASFYLMLLNI